MHYLVSLLPRGSHMQMTAGAILQRVKLHCFEDCTFLIRGQANHPTTQLRDDASQNNGREPENELRR